MDRFILANFFLAVIGFGGYAESNKPVPVRDAIFAALFLFVTAIDVKHNSAYILLYCGVICLIAGIDTVLNKGQNYKKDYPTEEIAEQVRRKDIFFFLSIAILAPAIYFGMTVFSEYVLAVLCVLLTAVFIMRARQTDKIAKRIKQWENEHVPPGYLPTDTERMAVNRSMIKAGLIVLAGIVISVCYMMYNPIFPIDSEKYNSITVLNIATEQQIEMKESDAEEFITTLNQMNFEEFEETLPERIVKFNCTYMLLFDEMPYYNPKKTIRMNVYESGDSVIVGVLRYDNFSKHRYLKLTDSEVEMFLGLFAELE